MFYLLKHENMDLGLCNGIMKYTWDAREKFGPGDRFLLGSAGALFAAPPLCEPFLFRRLLAGRCDSNKQSILIFTIT